jgi:DNA adenine methylase
MVLGTDRAKPLRRSVVHPVPYQGSKRKLAPIILDYFPLRARKLIEPFAGSAAVSLAALHFSKVEHVHLNDVLSPLIKLWQSIADTPKATADGYDSLWHQQIDDPRSFYEKTRSEFNEDQCPIKLLYLLARCVKSAVRFNQQGQFNQSADHRRLGAQPARMRKNIEGASKLLKGRLSTSSSDYSEVLTRATAEDIVYLDPPYQGTSGGKDQRYVQQLDFKLLTQNLDFLLQKRIPFILSFDGRCGAKHYGEILPKEMGLTRLEVTTGRSSQATLNGESSHSFESLYISPFLCGR